MTTSSQFKRLVQRDQRCLHCGETEAVAPNHRVNRGMGGSKRRDNPANLVLICSLLNGLIESDPKWAATARQHGWKLNSWEDPRAVPVFDVMSASWYILDDDYGRTVVRGRQD